MTPLSSLRVKVGKLMCDFLQRDQTNVNAIMSGQKQQFELH